MKQIVVFAAIVAIAAALGEESVDRATCNACPLNCVANSACPAVNPPRPVFLPHSDCTRYYVCETGRACEMNCPPGLHFNVREWVCDFPHRACCDATIECVPDTCIPGVTCPPTN
uniref:Chitin-binding type-2 domain-containing protein n=1 Tax=Anopheles dirus TaxID=7168 RepID=A0A182NR27_9DIPT